MTHKNNNITISEQLRDLVFRLREDPITYEKAISELVSFPTNDPIATGFQAGLEYSANSLEELMDEFSESVAAGKNPTFGLN